MNKLLSLLGCFLLIAAMPVYAQLDPILGQSGAYGVLASTSVSNTGISTVNGDLGISPGTQLNRGITLLVTGSEQVGTTAAANARASATAAFDNHKARPVTSTLTNQLGNGQILTPGVYKINGNATLSGVLVLNGTDNPNGIFVFIIDGNLTTSATTASVSLQGLSANNVYWIVEGSTTIGAANVFAGTIIAKEAVTLDAGATLAGRAISLNSSVNLNTSNIVLPAVVQADLSVQKTKVSAANSYAIGEEVTYQVTARNNGPDAAATVIVKEDFPAQLQYVSSTPSKGIYNQALKEWQLGALNNGEEVTLNIVFRAAAAGTNIINRVTIESVTPDANTSNNQAASPAITVVTGTGAAQADLSVQKTKVSAASSYAIGEEVTYQVTARNNGPDAAATVIVKEDFPAQLQYVSSTPNKGIYNQALNEWQLGALNNGEEGTLTITFRVAAAGTNLMNRVTIESVTPDANTANNQASSPPINTACAAPTLAITGQTDICLPTTNLTYSVTAVAGATYSFSLPNGWTPVSLTGNSVIAAVAAGASGGQIRATVTDACGNSYSVTKDVNVLSLPLTPVITGSANICANSEATYTATGIAGTVTYTWTGTGGLTIVNTNGNTALVRADASGGSLTASATNACGNTNSLPFVVTVTPAPATPGAITGAATVCANVEQTYSVAAVTGATAYVWTVPDGWQITGATGTTATTTVPEIRVRPGTAAGNITVRAQNTTNCQSTAATKAVTVGPAAPATPGAITASSGACIGTQATYSVTAVANATSYTWTVPTGWQIAGATGTTITTTAPTVTVTVGTGAGSIRVKAMNACGESQESSLSVPAVSAPAAVGAITGPTEVCAATTGIQYSISPVAGATTYTWTPPAGWTITAGAGTTNITVTTGAATNNAQLQVVAGNACGSTNATATVTVRAGLAVAGGITDNSSFCEGLSFSINAITGAASYTWVVPAGYTITAGQGTTSIRVQRTTPGATGQVTVAANNGFCDGPVASATISPSPVAGELVFPKAFSPNGDGINDTWLIPNLSLYSGNGIIIFNRWGSEVFRKNNYQNDWAGTGLEQGTYFYKASVRQCDGSDKEFTGYVSIYR